MRFGLLTFAVFFVISGCGAKGRDPTRGAVLLALKKHAISAGSPAFNPEHFQHPDYAVGYWDEAMSPVPKEDVVKSLDDELWTQGGYDPESLAKRADFEPFDRREGYHDYAALTAELSRLETEYPNLLRLESAGRSVEGRELWYVVISDDADAQEAEPKFIYHANMHGDEVVGRELMIYLIRHLVEQYGKEPRVTRIVDQAKLFIMPSMNPDGFERGTRANANGYDLNRNLPDRFDSPRDTPTGRQIEVQHMLRLAEQHHFVWGINWHGGEICFNLPWGNIRNTDANRYWDDSMFHLVGREYTQLNAPMYANHRDNFDHGLTYGYEWYPVNGGINDWFNWYRRSIHAVVELSVVKWPNARELPEFWSDNREAMLTHLDRGLTGLHLRVVDESGQLVPAVDVTLESAPGRVMRFDGGYVHRISDAGQQTVTVSAEGLKPTTLPLPAASFDGSFVTVTLRAK